MLCKLADIERGLKALIAHKKQMVTYWMGGWSVRDSALLAGVPPSTFWGEVTGVVEWLTDYLNGEYDAG